MERSLMDIRLPKRDTEESENRDEVLSFNQSSEGEDRKSRENSPVKRLDRQQINQDLQRVVSTNIKNLGIYLSSERISEQNGSDQVQKLNVSPVHRRKVAQIPSQVMRIKEGDSKEKRDDISEVNSFNMNKILKVRLKLKL
jgi:hypothetical protein